MTAHRFAQAIGAAALALLMVLGTAGVASARFSRLSAGTLSTTTFKLMPPTKLSATCNRTNGNRMPVVTFTASTSIGDVPNHAGTTPPQVFRYTTSLKVNGTANPAGTVTLSSGATKWSGLKQSSGTTLLFSIVTTYGGWKSVPATVTFQC